LNDFNLWFITGIEHIADLQGYDHILFLLALCGVYEIKQWKNVLVLITAFTIGHSITLALSVTNAFSINSEIIEFLIPITIILTASYNLYTNYKNKQNNPTNQLRSSSILRLYSWNGLFLPLKIIAWQNRKYSIPIICL
jgi:hypothetical protein